MKAVLAVAVLLTAPLAFARGDAQTRLLSQLHQESVTSIEVGQLTLLHGSSKAVVSFAANVARGQRQLNEAVVEYAKANACPLEPVTASPAAQPLRKLQGPELDRAFLVYVAETSDAMIAALRVTGGEGDPHFKRVVNRALATYREQRRVADRLLREVPLG